MLDREMFENISAYNLYVECIKWKDIKIKNGNICSLEDGEKKIEYVGLYYDLLDFLVMLDAEYDNCSFFYLKKRLLDGIIDEINKKTSIDIIDIIYLPITMRITVMVRA